MTKLMVMVAMLLTACVTEGGEPVDCGPAPTIEDSDFGAVANGDGTVTMTSERYSKTRDYVFRMRAWSVCADTCDPTIDKECMR